MPIKNIGSVTVNIITRLPTFMWYNVNYFLFQHDITPSPRVDTWKYYNLLILLILSTFTFVPNLSTRSDRHYELFMFCPLNVRIYEPWVSRKVSAQNFFKKKITSVFPTRVFLSLSEPKYHVKNDMMMIKRHVLVECSLFFTGHCNKLLNIVNAVFYLELPNIT